MQAIARADGRRQFRTVRDAVWHCDKIGGSAKLVALRLVEHLPDAFPSLDTLSGWTGLSVRTIRTALRELEAKEVIATRRNVRGRTNVYAFAFVGVSIPELGRSDLPPAPTEDEPRQISPPTTDTPTPAESAGVGGRFRRPGRQELPPKQEGKQTNKRGGGARARAQRPAAAPPPPLLFDFIGWECSPALRAELIQLGIPSERIEYRLKRLKNRPVNRGRGVVSLDDYVRENATEFWVAWESERQAKANCSHGNGVSSGFGVAGHNPGGLTWAPASGAGLEGYCKRWRLDLAAEAAEWKRQGHPVRIGGGKAADEAFKSYLMRRAKEEDRKRAKAA